MKRPAIIILTGLVLLTGAATAQNRNLNDKKLQRDLRIMEGVIDKVLASGQKARTYFSGSGTEGLYVDGYGMIFHTSKSINTVIHGRTSRRYAERIKAMEQRLAEAKEAEATARKKAEKLAEENVNAATGLMEIMTETNDEIYKEERGRIKDNLIQFYENYSPAISQLQPSDKIAVLVQMDSWSDNANVLTSWISATDINAMRKRQISNADFVKRIHFTENTARTQDLQTDIDILLEILERAMDQDTRYSAVRGRGLYLEGFGVMLFMEMPSIMFTGTGGSNTFLIAKENLIRSYTRKGEEITEEDVEAQKEKEAKRRNEIKDEMIELLADFGHTLGLNPAESVLLKIESGNQFIIVDGAPRKDSSMLIHLKKKDLDDYHEGRINLTGLKKRIIAH